MLLVNKIEIVFLYYLLKDNFYSRFMPSELTVSDFLKQHNAPKECIEKFVEAGIDDLDQLVIIILAFIFIFWLVF